MKKTIIRKRAFETNSSSCHSLSIDWYSGKQNVVPDSDGRITVSVGRFGWEVEEYNSFGEKASYILTSALRGADSTEKAFDKNAIEMLEAVIKEETGCNEVIFEFAEWHYVDHQSDDIYQEATKDKESLKAFLFNTGSYVKTDNDNH